MVGGKETKATCLAKVDGDCNGKVNTTDPACPALVKTVAKKTEVALIKRADVMSGTPTAVAAAGAATALPVGAAAAAGVPPGVSTGGVPAAGVPGAAAASGTAAAQVQQLPVAHAKPAEGRAVPADPDGVVPRAA